MKISYYSDTDSMYIDLSSKTSDESKEVSPGVVIDYDQEGYIVGIDIDTAGIINNGYPYLTNLQP